MGGALLSKLPLMGMGSPVPPGKPLETVDTALKKQLADIALNAARSKGATYTDVRIGRYRNQMIMMRASAERGTGKTLEVPNVFEDSSFGFGVRVIVNGAWGFASSPIVTSEEIARITGEAVTIAKAVACLRVRGFDGLYACAMVLGSEAVGRDAADCAWCTFYGYGETKRLSVEVAEE